MEVPDGQELALTRGAPLVACLGQAASFFDNEETLRHSPR